MADLQQEFPCIPRRSATACRSLARLITVPDDNAIGYHRRRSASDVDRAQAYPLNRPRQRSGIMAGHHGFIPPGGDWRGAGESGQQGAAVFPVTVV